MAGEQALTRSGLPIEVVHIERPTGVETAAREHPRVVRLAHWLNAISLVVMTMSGLQIFAAFPSFGPKIPQADLLAVPEALKLGGWLGGALQWHFTFAWIFSATGAVYAGYLAISGHWRHVVLRPSEVTGIWPMARHYFFFKPKPEAQEAYNPLQKLAYTSMLLCGACAVVTGLMLAKPVQLSALVSAVGGFGMVRVYHFAAMAGFLAFLPGHLVMVVLHGWNNFMSMATGWKRRPDYLR
jgi:thiosulfate reductase cytochrome b subunit